jgi:hypothetical protein
MSQLCAVRLVIIGGYYISLTCPNPCPIGRLFCANRRIGGGISAKHNPPLLNSDSQGGIYPLQIFFLKSIFWVAIYQYYVIYAT